MSDPQTTHPTPEILKRHYPWCSKIFDQIQQTKESQNGYKETYKEALKRQKEKIGANDIQI